LLFVDEVSIVALIKRVVFVRLLHQSIIAINASDAIFEVFQKALAHLLVLLSGIDSEELTQGWHLRLISVCVIDSNPVYYV